MREFFAKGMLLNVIAAIDLRGLKDAWVLECLGDIQLGPKIDPFFSVVYFVSTNY